MSKEETYPTIHRYLLDEMDKEEKTAFENKIETDVSMKTQVETERKLLAMLDVAADQELKNTIQSVHNKLDGEGFFKIQHTHKEAIVVDMNKRRTASRMLMALAASLAFVFAAWFFFGKTLDTEKLFATHYKQEQTITNKLLATTGAAGAAGQPESRDGRLALALDQYANGAFENANLLFGKLLSDFPDDNIVAFYSALTYMETGQADKAAILLKKLDNNKFEYRDAVKWYLGLCYLKNKKTDAAITTFKELERTGSADYKKQAKDILTETNK